MVRARYLRNCTIKWLMLYLAVFCFIHWFMFFTFRSDKEHWSKTIDSITEPSLHTFRREKKPTFENKSRKETKGHELISSGNHTGKLCQTLPQRFPPDYQVLSCLWRGPSSSCGHRLRVVLRCSNSSASIVEERVAAGTPPTAAAFNDSCLLRVVRERCSEKGHPVPRLVHYVQFSPGNKGRELPSHTFLSLVSSLRFVQPCLLLFHADYLPTGQYWERFLQLTSRVVHVNRTAPPAIFGHAIERIEHKADVARLEAIKTFGGIYVDTDEVILQPMDDLLRHRVTMAWESTNSSLGNGMFLSEPGHVFLHAWYESYRKFTNRWWGYFSTNVPCHLYKNHPEWKIHLVDTFFKPNMWNITKMVYQNHYDWSNHYALHLYYRRNHVYFKGILEQQKNTTLGEIARHILFGNKNRCM